MKDICSKFHATVTPQSCIMTLFFKRDYSAHPPSSSVTLMSRFKSVTVTPLPHCLEWFYLAKKRQYFSHWIQPLNNINTSVLDVIVRFQLAMSASSMDDMVSICRNCVHSYGRGKKISLPPFATEIFTSLCGELNKQPRCIVSWSSFGQPLRKST